MNRLAAAPACFHWLDFIPFISITTISGGLKILGTAALNASPRLTIIV